MNSRTVFLFGCLIASTLANAVVSSAADKKTTTKGPTRTLDYESIGKIERLDKQFDQLVPIRSQIRRIASGYKWSEGPVWVRSGNFLLFSDVPGNTVHKFKEREGVTEFLRPSGYTGEASRGGEGGSNGLTMDSEGHLVLCQHGDRRIARLESDGKFTTLADRFDGKRFNSPNDLVYKSNGDLYFTDPPYGLEGKNKDPNKEIPFSGVYRLSKSGEVTLLTKELTFPNGIAFSPDEKTLYVAVSDPKHAVWMAYDVQPDGTIANGRVFFDVTSMVSKDRPGLPDGMKVDNAGNLFATGPGGVLVISKEGKHLGTLNTGEPTANVAWGEYGSVLYITANHYLCRIQTSTKGKIP